MESKPYLIQRINRPQDPVTVPEGLVGYYSREDPVVLTPEERDALRNILRLDYMGSAEFEFGAVPQALRNIAKTEDRVVTTLTLEGVVRPLYSFEKPIVEPGEKRGAIVQFISSAKDSEELHECFKTLFEDDHAWRLKEHPHIRAGLLGFLFLNNDRNPGSKKNNWKWEEHHVCGWLGCDSHNNWIASCVSSQFDAFRKILQT